MGFLSSSSDDILDNLPDAVFALSYDRKVLFCNKAAENLFGYSKREIKNKDIETFLEEGMEFIYDSMINNRRNNVRAKTKAGADIVIEVSAYDSEIKQQIFVTGRDITETHAIIKNVIDDYKANQEKIKKRNAFIADMSGELKNPMHSIIGFSQALLEGIGGELSEKQQKYLNIINKNGVALFSTLDAIVDITMLDAGRVPIEKRDFDVTNLVNLVVQGVKPIAQEKELECTAEFLKLEKLKIYSDENLVRKVLTSLLENAVKFTKEGNIKVSVSNPTLDFVRLQGIFVKPKDTDASYIMFSVIDTGIGIAEKDLDNIFDEYSILEKSKKEQKENIGTQLTIPIARKIVDELGGVIWVESEQNSGSKFSFIIPAQKTTTIKEIIENE